MALPLPLESRAPGTPAPQDVLVPRAGVAINTPPDPDALLDLFLSPILSQRRFYQHQISISVSTKTWSSYRTVPRRLDRRDSRVRDTFSASHLPGPLRICPAVAPPRNTVLGPAVTRQRPKGSHLRLSGSYCATTQLRALVAAAFPIFLLIHSELDPQFLYYLLYPSSWRTGSRTTLTRYPGTIIPPRRRPAI